MEDRKEGMNGGAWMSVPAFGDWDKNQAIPDYSMDFSKIREHRKIHKSDFSRASLGNDDELASSGSTNQHHHRASSDQSGEHRDLVSGDHHRPHHIIHRDHSPTTRKRIMSYFQCCIGA